MLRQKLSALHAREATLDEEAAGEELQDILHQLILEVAEEETHQGGSNLQIQRTDPLRLAQTLSIIEVVIGEAEDPDQVGTLMLLRLFTLDWLAQKQRRF